MNYVKFGSTGLEVSRFSLGYMIYGDPGCSTHPWTQDEEASRPPIQKAIEAGINFFDTADVSSKSRISRTRSPASTEPARARQRRVVTE